MAPKKKESGFRRVEINYPPVPTRKWRPPYKPHVSTPFKRKPHKRLPFYPHFVKFPNSSLKKIWHEYKVFNKNSLVLFGKYALHDLRYQYPIRGKQGPSVCFVAIGYTKMKPMDKWDANSICKIMEIGTKLYYQSVAINKNTCDCTSPKEVFRSYFIDDYKIILSVEDEAIHGYLNKHEGEAYIKNELKTMFARTHFCLIEIEGKFMTILKDKGSFYIFDPNDRDYTVSRVQDGTGVATVLKYIELGRMIKHIQDIFAPNGAKVQFTLTVMHIKKMYQASLIPPETLDFKKPATVFTPKTCLFTKVPSKTDYSKIGPIPEPITAASKVRIKKSAAAESQAEATEPTADSNTPSFTDLFSNIGQRQDLIPVEKPEAPEVSYYKCVIPNKMAILIGSCHQNSGKCTLFEGKQSLGNAIGAIGMLRQYKSKFWYPKLIDEILLTGEIIYMDSRQQFMGDDELNLSNVVKTFTINKKQYEHTIVEATIIGRLNSQIANVVDLKEALREFFADYTTGIIRGPLVIAVWVEDGKFYMFDPNERDKKGRLIEKQYSTQEPNGLVSECGYACVTWFREVGDMAKLYMNNLSREAKEDFFYISKIEVKEYIEISDPWYNYVPLKSGKWILRATHSQNDPRFKPAFRNYQSTCMAAMAIAAANCVSLEEWDRPLLDEILVEGNNLYSSSVDNLKTLNAFENKSLTLYETFRSITYKGKILNIEVHECYVNGLLTMLKPIWGIPDLRQGIEEFFVEYNAAVLTARGISLAFWKHEGYYYYFDSHPKSDEGYIYEGGTACVIRFESMREMIEVIFANLVPRHGDVYNIGRIDISIWDITDEGVIQPDFHDYLEIYSNKGIIRSSNHQGDVDVYDLRADYQTIPNLLAAFGMSTILPSSRWNKIVMDQILTLGDDLYEKSRYAVISNDLLEFDKWETQEKPVDMYTITTENVVKSIKIGLNVIKFEIKEPQEGIFEPERVKRDKNGNVIYQKYELQNLLWNALENKDVGKLSKHEIILDSEHISLAIWKEGDLYFIFDPKGKDAEGNFYGRDLWSAKIVILDEDYNIPQDMTYGNTEFHSELMKEDTNPEINADIEENLIDEEEEDMEEEILSFKIDISDAKACTIMFTAFDDLYKHILENVRPNKRIDHFKIYPIVMYSMPDTKRITNPQDKSEGDWYNFEEIEMNKWILRGSMNINDNYFSEINRGKQYGAMCITALVYCRLYSMPTFKNSTVDYILKYGDKLHTASRRSKENEMKANKAVLGLSDGEIMSILAGQEMKPSQIVTEFLLGDYHVMIEVTATVVEGDIAVKEKPPTSPPAPGSDALPPETKETSTEDIVELKPRKSRLRRMISRSRYEMSISGASIYDSPPVGETPSGHAITQKDDTLISLRKGLKKFFDQFEFGILTMKGLSIAIWKINGFYYMFDPACRGRSGMIDNNGGAFIMRFGKSAKLLDLIVTNMNLNSTTRDGSNTFQMDAVMIKSKRAERPVPSIKDVIPAKPKMTAFREVNPNTLILRGNFNQDNPKFNLSTNAAGACNAIVALAMGQIHPPETWSRPIVDDVVMNGCRLYKQSVLALGNDFNEWDDKMVVHSVAKDFKIGVINVRWEVNSEGIEKGILSIKSPEVPNLRSSCEQYFSELDAGIIESSPLTLAVWVCKGLFYVFDPNPRGPTGLYCTGGTACLLLFNSVKDVVNHFLSNVPPRLYQEEFSIIPVNIYTSETKPEKNPPMKKSEILKVKEIDSLAGYIEDDKPSIGPKKKKLILPKPDSPLTCDKKNKSKSVNSRKAKSIKEPCCCPDKSKLTTNKPMKVEESMFSPEDKKKWVREKSEAKKIKELEAKEHRLRAEFYVLDNGDAIVRAHYSQNANKFSALSRNKQTHANALVAIVMSKLHEPKTWSYKNIEIILESGDVLYKDSYLKYRSHNPLLGLKNLLRTFYILHLKINTVIYQPFTVGDCTYEDIYVGLLNFFMQETSGIIVCYHESYAVAIFQKAGHYYMFDPHDRDVKGDVTTSPGCACLLRFNCIENLVDKFLKNSGVDLSAETVPLFSICAVSVESVERITK